ncbi:magnesium transporter MgtC [Paenibacillus sp. LMG 31456]|uniref:Magnesium transporter MgtC n=1 Tax=Paenibacillus foliorum TaxID=2654974 RepID=A0A972K5P8_9BACL|nr:MgtC/SapB family protein [Paenibacillus foliorum]NOU97282.1 magnesium transporter MgtC [Paenibacillus foliorum]
MGTTTLWTISHGELLLRMVLAVLFGGAVGMEREWNNHAAGFRTHILVCLGSATIMLLSIYGFSEYVNEPNVRIDPARLAAQVISGIGFLGAGAILRNGSVISGLTTAASVWVVAAIGLCVGAGFLFAAFYTTMLVLISLFVLNKWEKYLMRHRRNHELTIKALDNPGVLGKLASAFGEQGIQIVNVKMVSESDSSQESREKPTLQLRFSLKVQNPTKFIAAMERINTMDFVLWMESDGKLLVFPHQHGVEHAN